MKKILPAIAILTSIAISHVCFAEDIGVNEIIYQSTGTTIEAIDTTTLPNNICFDIIKKHLILAKVIGPANPTDDALITIKNLENLVKTDIIQAMSLSTDRQKTLNDYLNDSNTYLEKGNAIVLSLNQELALVKLDLRACQADKDLADKEYFQGVDTYDNDSSQRALDQSIANEKCVSENRIEYNAKVYLLDKIVFFEGLLKQRYDILYEQQDLVVNHFDVISDKILQKLEEINSILKSYEF